MPQISSSKYSFTRCVTRHLKESDKVKITRKMNYASEIQNTQHEYVLPTHTHKYQKEQC